jgi:F420-0:gamma-glutamyl ligase
MPMVQPGDDSPRWSSLPRRRRARVEDGDVLVITQRIVSSGGRVPLDAFERACSRSVGGALGP